MAHVNWNGTQVLHMFTIFFSFLVTSIWHTRSMSKYLNSATSTSNMAHLSQRPPVDRKRTQITPLRPRPSPRIQRPRSRQKTDTNNPTPSDNLQSWPLGPCLGGQDDILSDIRVICVLSDFSISTSFLSYCSYFCGSCEACLFFSLVHLRYSINISSSKHT